MSVDLGPDQLRGAGMCPDAACFHPAPTSPEGAARPSAGPRCSRRSPTAIPI